jgi:hypothetical protein
MVCAQNFVFWSGLDLSEQEHTVVPLRMCAKGRHASGQAHYVSDQQLCPQARIDRPVVPLRLQVELFFKWIREHLRIKSSLGASVNAVKTQIWFAVCTYFIITIVKKRFHPPHRFYQILRFMCSTVFETTPINQLQMPPSTDSAEGFELQ